MWKKTHQNARKKSRATKALLLRRWGKAPKSTTRELNDTVLFRWSICITLRETWWQILTPHLTKRCDREMINIYVIKVVNFNIEFRNTGTFVIWRHRYGDGHVGCPITPCLRVGVVGHCANFAILNAVTGTNRNSLALARQFGYGMRNGSLARLPVRTTINTKCKLNAH